MREDFKDFKNFIKGKKVAVVGIGVSNTPLVRFLIDLGANIIACDKKKSLGDIEDYLISKKCTLSLGDDYLEGILDADVVFRTPSLLPSNKYLIKAKQNGAYITSEIKELIKYTKGKVFAITGSDGKTTTTTLIGEILKKAGNKVYVGGNIGTPLFTKIEDIKEEDYVVLELSSFQLMDVNENVDVAVITNISPNHLDIHKDYEEYIEAKQNIYKGSTDSTIVILNKDDSITDNIKCNGIIRKFSRKQNAYAHIKEGSIYVNDIKVINKKDIKLKGEHNIENLLTAYSATYDYASIDDMKYVGENFTGVAHRIEFVRDFNGIKYYNDSIASTPTRTLAGLRSFNEKVILICGGYDKNIPFEPLAEGGINKIKHLIVMGNTKEKIKSAFNDKMDKDNIEMPIFETSSIEDAVSFANTIAKEGDVVLLSPACASFDMFINFEERGNRFKEIVSNL